MVGLLVLWAGVLQFRVMRTDSQVAAREAQFKQFEARYNVVRTNQDHAVEITQRIAALHQLATNRFLWATPLNALQFTVVPNVHLVRLKTEQVHSVTEVGRPTTNTSGVVKATPASAKETIVMKLEARDYSATAGDEIPRFLEALNSHPCFQTNQVTAKLTGRTAPQSEPGETARPFVLFTVDCQYPERAR